MLKQRVLSAAVLIPFAIGFLYLGGWWFAALVALVSLLAGYEAFAMLRRPDCGGHEPFVWWGEAVLLLLVISAMFDGDGRLYFPLITGILLVTLSYALFRYPRTHRAATDWAITIAVALYLGTFMRYGVLLRNRSHGLEWVAVGLVLTWIIDSGAYFVGMALGEKRHPLAPQLSPKKSKEGVIGGTVSGILAALLLVPWLLPHVSRQQALLLGVLLSIIAPVGDLVESMFKRQCNLKDSGRLIPGHGGAFDRIDSLLFVVPTVYWLAVWWGG